jgi:hypothetical protein
MKTLLLTTTYFFLFAICSFAQHSIFPTHAEVDALVGITLPDTTGVAANFIPKYDGAGGIAWAADAGGAGSDSASYFEKGSIWHPTDSLMTIDEIAAAYQPLATYLIPSDSTAIRNYSNALYATASHTHTEFYDTLSKSWGVMDTVTTGDYVGWKVENNITITEVAAYTNTGTVTFNIEERGETTPNTTGTDVMTSDLVADTDQQETGTFSNADVVRNAWLVPAVASITGDPTVFGFTIRYIKTN